MFHFKQFVKSKVNNFDKNKKTDYYDIRSLGELLHFLDNTDSRVYGRELIEAYKENIDKTILLVSHELSLSGAPIVLLQLAEALKRKGFQTIIICGLDGDKFLDNAALKEIPVVYYPGLLKSHLVFSIRKLFSKIIVNTIICAPVINQLIGTDSSVIWWIHEAREIYNGRAAREMPMKVTDNIRIYSVGSYAKKALLSRFPRYKVKSLIYSVPDLTKVPNISDFHIDLPNKKIFALFGSIQYRKGQDILKKAIERLPEKIRKECFFLFVGYNSNPKISDMLLELNNKYPDNVLYMNEIKLNDLFGLFYDIDFLICASRDDPMPVVIANSMSLGKPCICSEYTGSAPIIDQFNAGFVYRRNSPAALAQKIEDALFLKQENYESMSKNARLAYEQLFSELVFEKELDRCLGVQ